MYDNGLFCCHRFGNIPTLLHCHCYDISDFLCLRIGKSIRMKFIEEVNSVEMSIFCIWEHHTCCFIAEPTVKISVRNLSISLSTTAFLDWIPHCSSTDVRLSIFLFSPTAKCLKTGTLLSVLLVQCPKAFWLLCDDFPRNYVPAALHYEYALASLTMLVFSPIFINSTTRFFSIIMITSENLIKF